MTDVLNCWPVEVSKELLIPDATLVDYLDAANNQYADKPAIIYCDRTVTYKDLFERVRNVSECLKNQLNVSPKDRVLLIGQNCPQFVESFYAILRVGAVVVPINPMSTVQEIQYYMENSGATVAICAQELLPNVEPLLQLKNGLKHIVVFNYCDELDEVSRELLPQSMRVIETLTCNSTIHAFRAFETTKATSDNPIRFSIHDLAVLPYTSGTTGKPKGCMHTHRTVLASNIASQNWRNLTSESVFLCVAPIFHMLGMQNGMNMPITLGATVVMMPRWNAAQAVDLVEKYKVSVWAAPPAMVIDFFAQPSIERRDLTGLKLLSGGGAAMPEAVAKLLADRFNLYYNEAYGLTETAAFLHANPIKRGKKQCLGMPTQGVESKIIDPSTLQPLPQGEVGELVTMGQQVMSGYWQDEKANLESFIDVEGKRFFRTGDLAFVDDEGYYFMRDRLKRMINVSGFKVWPAEVESMMYENPHIHEACIVSVPDQKSGEAVKALVVLKPASRGQINNSGILEWCRTRMSAYKVPKYIEFMEFLPKSGTGKILWRELQEQQLQKNE